MKCRLMLLSTAAMVLLTMPVQAGFLTIQELDVPSTNPVGVSSTVSLNAGASYQFEVSGTWDAFGGNWPCDAEHTDPPAPYGDPGPVWVDTPPVPAPDNYDDYLELLVNGSGVEWGPYNAGHVYTLAFSGLGSTVQFAVNEIAGQFGNNSGNLHVKIQAHHDLTVDVKKANMTTAIPGALVKYSLNGGPAAVLGTTNVSGRVLGLGLVPGTYDIFVEYGSITWPIQTVVLTGSNWGYLKFYSAELTLSSTVGGNVTTPGEGVFKYYSGQSVAVVATADAGYAFHSWTGTAVTAGKVTDPCSASTGVLMDNDYALEAKFLPTSKLTLSSTAGGNVTTPGEGVFVYFSGTNVAVVATPDAGCIFSAWTGSAVAAGKVANTTSASTSVLLDSDYTLEARFIWPCIGSTYAASQITEQSAVLRGGIVTDGGEACEYRFVYWAQGQSPITTEWMVPAYTYAPAYTYETLAYRAQDLMPGVLYTFRVDVRNTLGEVVDKFDTRSFRTLARITISANRGGSVVLPGQGAFVGAANSSISVQAQASSFFEFASWTGTAVDAGLVKDAKAASTTVKLIGDKTLTANFDVVPSLVAYYPFNGNANEVYNPVKNNGVPSGSPNYLATLFNKAISLDGLDDCVEIPAVVDEDWTIGMWLRVNDPNADESPSSRLGVHPDFFYGYGLVNADVGGNANDWGTAFEVRALKFGVGKASTGPNMTLIAYDAIMDTEWHHVAFTRNATTGEIAIYVDGKIGATKVADPNDPSVLIPAPARMLAHPGIKNAMAKPQIGAINKTDGLYLNGQIDEMYFFNYVLDANDIADMATIITIAPMQNLVVDLNNQIQSIDGVDVKGLILAKITTDFEKYQDRPAVDGQNFDLNTYTSLDDSTFVKLMFAGPVSMVFLVERGGNDQGYFQALDATGKPMGQRVPFAQADWFMSAYMVSGQIAGGITITASTPVNGIMIWPADNATSKIDPASVSGVPVL